MSDYAWMASAIAVLFAGAVGVFDRLADQEAAKAGLQQCRVENVIVWQKECSK
jgi:uncharacterized membrane protein